MLFRIDERVSEIFIVFLFRTSVLHFSVYGNFNHATRVFDKNFSFLFFWFYSSFKHNYVQCINVIS